MDTYPHPTLGAASDITGTTPNIVAMGSGIGAAIGIALGAIGGLLVAGVAYPGAYGEKQKGGGIIVAGTLLGAVVGAAVGGRSASSTGVTAPST